MAYRPGKGAISAVVAKLPPPAALKKGGGAAEGPKSKKEAGMDVGKMSAAEDLFAALGIKPKDKDAAVSALSDFVKICYGDEE